MSDTDEETFQETSSTQTKKKKTSRKSGSASEGVKKPFKKPEVVADGTARTNEGNDSDSSEEFELPSEFISFEEMSVAKKSLWAGSAGVRKMMETYLCDSQPASWTMKRLLLRIVEENNIAHLKHDNAESLGRRVDFWRNSDADLDVDDGPVQRWSAKLDIARLLQVMFGDDTARAAYIKSRKLATRLQLDDTSRQSLKVCILCQMRILCVVFVS